MHQSVKLTFTTGNVLSSYSYIDVTRVKPDRDSNPSMRRTTSQLSYPFWKKVFYLFKLLLWTYLTKKYWYQYHFNVWYRIENIGIVSKTS